MSRIPEVFFSQTQYFRNIITRLISETTTSVRVARKSLNDNQHRKKNAE